MELSFTDVGYREFGETFPGYSDDKSRLMAFVASIFKLDVKTNDFAQTLSDQIDRYSRWFTGGYDALADLLTSENKIRNAVIDSYLLNDQFGCYDFCLGHSTRIRYLRDYILAKKKFTRLMRGMLALGGVVSGFGIPAAVAYTTSHADIHSSPEYGAPTLIDYLSTIPASICAALLVIYARSVDRALERIVSPETSHHEIALRLPSILGVVGLSWSLLRPATAVAAPMIESLPEDMSDEWKVAITHYIPLGFVLLFAFYAIYKFLYYFSLKPQSSCGLKLESLCHRLRAAAVRNNDASRRVNHGTTGAGVPLLMPTAEEGTEMETVHYNVEQMVSSDGMRPPHALEYAIGPQDVVVKYRNYPVISTERQGYTAADLMSGGGAHRRGVSATVPQIIPPVNTSGVTAHSMSSDPLLQGNTSNLGEYDSDLGYAPVFPASMRRSFDSQLSTVTGAGAPGSLGGYSASGDEVGEASWGGGDYIPVPPVGVALDPTVHPALQTSYDSFVDARARHAKARHASFSDSERSFGSAGTRRSRHAPQSESIRTNKHDLGVSQIELQLQDCERKIRDLQALLVQSQTSEFTGWGSHSADILQELAKVQQSREALQMACEDRTLQPVAW